MNTIIVDIEDMDFERYDGCAAPLMFDEFKLIVNSIHLRETAEIEAKLTKEGFVMKLNNQFFYGVRFGMTYDEAHPEPGMYTLRIYENGDVGIGWFYIPLKLNNSYELDKACEALTSDSYQLYIDAMIMVFNIMVCIMMMGKERRRLRKKSNVNAATNGHDKKSIVKKDSKVFLLEDIVEYVADNHDEQHREIQCPCWEVRGHYRRYKSGKEVFIPAYKKGKQRDRVAPKPKEYCV